MDNEDWEHYFDQPAFFCHDCGKQYPEITFDTGGSLLDFLTHVVGLTTWAISTKREIIC